MRAERAFRLSGRARGVKDGGVVLRIERARPATADPATDARSFTSPMMDSSLVTCGCATSSLVAADKDALERRTVVQMFEQPLEPLAIDDGDLGAGIVEAVLQFRPGPPGIEQSRDTADEQTTKERAPAIPADCAWRWRRGRPS